MKMKIIGLVFLLILNSITGLSQQKKEPRTLFPILR